MFNVLDVLLPYCGDCCPRPVAQLHAHTSNKTTEHLCGRRMYIEQYSDDVSKHKEDAQAALAAIISVALDISKLTEFTGRDKPTVIT